MTLSHMLRCSILILFIGNSGLSCQSQQSAPLEQAATKVKTTEKVIPKRSDLARALFKSKSITLVYGDQSPDYSKRYSVLLEEIKSSDQSGLNITIVPASKITTTQLKNENLFIIGSWSSCPVFQKFTQEIFHFSKNKFTFEQTVYSSPAQSLSINIFPNSLNTKQPISFVFGNSDEEVIAVLRQRMEQSEFSFFWSSWGYEIYEDSERLKMGNFNDSNWLLGEGFQYDATQKNAMEWQSDHFRLQSQNFQFDKGQAQQLLNNLENRYQRVESFFLQQHLTSELIDYKIYNRAESKGLGTRNTHQAHYDLKKNTIYEVKNEIYADRESSVLNELLLSKKLGLPNTHALLKGLAVLLTNDWQQKGFKYWASRLYYSNNLIPLEELLYNNQLAELSELATAPLLASFVDYLITKYGKSEFLKNYPAWQVKAGEITRLEKEWHQHIRSAYSDYSSISPTTTIPYLKGFNFAHEGYAIYNGYGSKLAQQSLVEINQVGSNAVAIVPYTYMRNPRIPNPLPLMKRAGTEDDAGTVRSSYDAQQLGMSSMLKPQIWLRGSWPGDVEMTTDLEWEQWFDYYYKWMLHYALLAEMYDFDQLCVGVEFVKATTQRPDDWKKLIGKLRGIYSGPITYAANWGEEFEQIDLWKELDFIGLNCYYPLGQEATLTQDQLNQRFAKILLKVEKVAKKYNKPIVFTEIGFRNVNQCWRNPHAEANGRAANQTHQLMCYQAVAEGIKDKDWCKGILWWKWPSYMDYSQRNSTSFTPSGKKAEDFVKVMFK